MGKGQRKRRKQEQQRWQQKRLTMLTPPPMREFLENDEEDFEVILAGLPIGETSVPQRVCEIGRAVIQERPAVRNQMFVTSVGTPLKPSLPPPGHDPSDVCEYGQTVRLNPLLSITCDDCGASDPRQPQPCPASFAVPVDAAGTKLNVCITLLILQGLLLGKDTPRAWPWMLLTEPPVTALTLYQLWDTGRDTSNEHPNEHVKCTTYNPAGINLGNIYGLHQRLYEQYLGLIGMGCTSGYLLFSIPPEQGRMMTAKEGGTQYRLLLQTTGDVLL